MKIPFNKPYITGNELKYIEDLIMRLDNGEKISGDGNYTKKVQNLIESKFFTRKALLTTSCTSAIEMATLLLNLNKGDEVILPTYTFASTANPIIISGGTPVFVDISEDTLNIDPKKIEEKINYNTKAIYVMHYAGVSCQMKEISKLAKKYGLIIVEDAAQGVNSKYNDQYLGTIGEFGCYSFHETKNYTSGEGGALLINTEDLDIQKRAEVIREKGTNRSKFIRGEVDKYTWVDIGSSYVLSDILAAFLYAQLEKINEIQAKRIRIFNYYLDSLKELKESGKLNLPTIPKYATHNAHLFYILLENNIVRNNLMNYLKDRGIHSTFHYIPLHTSPMGQKLGYKQGDLPISESSSEKLLRLPLYADMSSVEINYVINTIYDFFK